MIIICIYIYIWNIKPQKKGVSRNWWRHVTYITNEDKDVNICKYAIFATEIGCSTGCKEFCNLTPGLTNLNCNFSCKNEVQSTQTKWSGDLRCPKFDLRSYQQKWGLNQFKSTLKGIEQQTAFSCDYVILKQTAAFKWDPNQDFYYRKYS